MTTVLPDGLKFLEFGWWVIHAAAILLVYAYAYRKGLKDGARRARRPASGDEAPPRPRG